MIQKKSLNGSHREQKPEQIEFPVTYILKVVLQLSNDSSKSEKEIETLLDRLKIPFSFLEARISSKQTYISHNIRVTLINKAQMDELYENLKQIPGIKFAL